MDDNRIVTKKELRGDQLANFRPTTFSEYVGQDKVKKRLEIVIQAAKSRKEPLDHILFSGPPGLGKTTLAFVVAREMGVNIRVTSGPVIERQGDLAAILTSLATGDILFIDEIHRMNRVVEEVFYPAMEDFKLDIVIGRGPGAKTVRISLNRFTLIGATTRIGKVSSPLRNRFGMLSRLDYYRVEDLKKIILRGAELLNVSINDEGATEIARCARGTPRIALRLLKRIRDYCQVQGSRMIDREIAIAGLNFLEIDRLGLDAIDIRILRTMVDNFNGGPVSLDTVADSVGEEPDTIYDVYEPYLIQIGFLQRTPRGRIVTKKALNHLGYSPAAVTGKQLEFGEYNE